MRISDWSADVCSSDLGDGVAARLVAAEVEGRDVHAGIAQGPAQRADHARLVTVGQVEHVRAELGLHRDALDLDDSRPVAARTEERRGGKAGVRTGRSRWAP